MSLSDERNPHHILRGHQPGDLPPVRCRQVEGPQGTLAHPGDSLIWLAVAGGSIGALGAMFLFRHKTRHLKFILGIPAILLLQVLLVFWLLRR